MFLTTHFPKGLYCTQIGADKQASDMTHLVIPGHEGESTEDQDQYVL
jgi:hypothetical protein